MHNRKIARVLDLIINEEKQSASILLHEFLVDESKKIWEELEGDEIEGIEEENDALDEDFGEDSEKESFVDDIAQDVDDIEADEHDDMSDVDSEADEFESEEESEEEAEEEATLDSLQQQLADLQASFDALIAQEEDEGHDFSDIEGDESEEEGEFEFGDDEGSENEFGFEDESEEMIGEATKMHNEVKVPAMKDTAPVKTSPYSKAPSKADFGGKPTDFAKAAGDGKQAPKVAKKEKVEDNIDVKEKAQKADMKREGKLSGTGKGGEAGKVDTKTLLSKKPK